MIFLFPPLFGEGYTTLRSLLTDGDIAASGPLPLTSPAALPLFFLQVLLLKVLAMTFTNAGGRKSVV